MLKRQLGQVAGGLEWSLAKLQPQLGHATSLWTPRRVGAIEPVGILKASTTKCLIKRARRMERIIHWRFSFMAPYCPPLLGVALSTSVGVALLPSGYPAQASTLEAKVA